MYVGADRKQVRSSHHETGARLWTAVLAYYLAATAVVTLVPFRFRIPAGYEIMLRGTPFDVAANVLMFVPLGLLHRLARGRRGEGGTLGVLGGGLLVSTLLELAQLFAPARFSSPLDVLANGAGAWLGAVVCDRLVRGAGAGAVLVGRLSLEVPLMGLAWLVLPLLWLGSAAGAGEAHRIALLALPGLFGATLVADVHRHRQGRPGAVPAGALATAVGIAMLIGVLPAAARQPATAALLVLGVASYTRVAATLPVSPYADRRFEAATLRRALPFHAAYLLVLAWTAVPPTDGAGTVAILRILELTGAFAVLGYLLGEWRGRLDLPRAKAFAGVFVRALPAAAIAATGIHPERGGAAAAALLAVGMAAALFGAVIYLLQRDHVRALTRAREAGEAPRLSSAAEFERV